MVFLCDSIGKPPRPRAQRMLRDIFLIARPPLLAVMQGGDYASFPIYSSRWLSSMTRRQMLSFRIGVFAEGTVFMCRLLAYILLPLHNIRESLPLF